MKLWINPPLESTKNAGNLPCIILKNGFLKYVTQPSSKITQKSSNFCFWLVQCAKKLLAKTGSCDTGSLKLGTTSLDVVFFCSLKVPETFANPMDHCQRNRSAETFFIYWLPYLKSCGQKIVDLSRDIKGTAKQ